MRKWRGICVILLSAVLLFGCADQQEQEIEKGEELVQQKENETLENDGENRSPDIIEGVTKQGFLTADSLASLSVNQVHLFRQRGKDGYEVVLEVTSGDDVLRKELGFSSPPSLGDRMYLSDVDGNGFPEIVIHYDTGGCGGFGSYISLVLKIENDQILTLFETHSEFDTGFTSSFVDGYQMNVTNAHTGYSLVFDAKEHYSEVFFDENGKATSHYPFFLDRFFEFEPKDVDGDGIYEIACKQYTHLQGHADYVGNACSVLKYNADTQSFEVIDAWFEPYTEE